MLLSVEQVTKSYGDRVLLDGVSFYLERGDKVGIIGVNGAGKSTLLRLLAGAEEPDGGTVRLDPGVRMEYLPQNPVFQGERTVLEQVLLGLNDADRSLAEYEARTILNRLGVSRFEQSVGNLSGGERRRVALAAVLARPCDVLILDEPTNHLDNDMVLWLEDYLRAWKGALVMVTHDRYFLERIVGRMAEEDLTVCLVTDAGTPCISDPGYRVVEAAWAAGIPVQPISGPSAVVDAISVSGFSAESYAFFGFLPRQGREREEAFARLAACPTALAVLYESPHRVKRLVADLQEALQDPMLSLSCDLTKLHEKTLRGRAGEVLAALEANPNAEKGEYVCRSEERRVGKECRSRWSPYH